jgi:hypothetical protein
MEINSSFKMEELSQKEEFLICGGDGITYPLELSFLYWNICSDVLKRLWNKQ